MANDMTILPDATVIQKWGSQVVMDAAVQRTFLQKVVGIAPCLIYVFNHVTQSNEYANREVGEFMGYSPAELQEMGSELLQRVIHPEDLPLIMAHFAALQDMKDGEIAELEYRVLRKDGGWTWLLAHDTNFERDEAGRVLRHIGVATDITTQKVAAKALLEEKRNADAANEELRSFAYSVSHDLKSPSNTLDMLLGELEQSQGERLDEDGRELLDLSLNTVHRMQVLIEDVLAYTRVVGEDNEHVPVCLERMLKDIRADFRHDLSLFGGRIDVGPLPSIMGSGMQMSVLFRNLIANALKYSRPDTPPVVTISDVTRDGAEKVSISVTDNGIGIPPDSHERIFGLFNRLHLDDAYEGSGLGLTICRRVALNHGGDITVHSVVGKGSSFTVALERA